MMAMVAKKTSFFKEEMAKFFENKFCPICMEPSHYRQTPSSLLHHYHDKIKCVGGGSERCCKKELDGPGKLLGY